ncbi:inverted formin-2-like, partial [Homarus americanus]|uniref:inverted formin-2-like n=1 Tax=Homarus americanus TaxID=6706 RepID=UPI001C48F633
MGAAALERASWGATIPGRPSRDTAFSRRVSGGVRAPGKVPEAPAPLAGSLEAPPPLGGVLDVSVGESPPLGGLLVPPPSLGSLPSLGTFVGTPPSLGGTQGAPSRLGAPPSSGGFLGASPPLRSTGLTL